MNKGLIKTNGTRGKRINVKTILESITTCIEIGVENTVETEERGMTTRTRVQFIFCLEIEIINWKTQGRRLCL